MEPGGLPLLVAAQERSGASPREMAAITAEACLRRLASSDDGLSSAQAARRLGLFGRNEVPAGPGRNLAVAFLSQFTHVLALLLWVASFLAFVGRLPELGWAIIAVIVINGVFSFVQEYRAGRLLAALRRQVEALARVRREGSVVQADARGLVPGDIIVLSEGDRVPADARLLSSFGLEVDQSSLTGESEPVAKDAATLEAAAEDLPSLANVVYADTLVVRGDGEAVVFATGRQTQFGGISAMASAVEVAAGPLEREIETLARTTAVVAIVAGLAIWGISAVILEREVSEGFVFAVGVIVALVPEGLLPTLSLSLAISVQRMARRNALVRRLSSVEALGATQVICTDKTGTLTRNEMTVEHVWAPGAEYEVTGVGYEPEGDVRVIHGEANPQLLADIVRTATLASNATVGHDADGRWTIAGDPTEAAIVVAARKIGVEARAERVAELPFDSFRRMMSTIDREEDGTALHVKGAVDAVLERSTRGPGGGPMDSSRREEVARQADGYARRGMRVLAVARRLGLAASAAQDEDVERELEFLGLIAMMDPIRPEAIEAIRKCHGAGIRVVIITGDHQATAAAVAQRAGVVRGRPHVVTGRDLEVMSPDALRAALLRDVVFARATPADKLTIVTALQDMGQVVAVIGDGVNDAPSLRRADVGVAMGRSGTDVAREAADIVLMDDNFATIVDAIEEGRATFSNIRKFVTYVFTSNVAELAPFAAFVLTGIPLPLKVLQILAVDLGTDLLPALGLGAEGPEPGTLREPPRARATGILDRAVFLRTFLLLGPIEAALGLAGYFFVYWSDGWRFGDSLVDSGDTYLLATTIAFAAIVTGQVGAVFACRSARTSLFRMPLLANPILLFGVGAEIALLLIAVYVSPVAGVFDFAPLGWRGWLFLAAVLPLLPLADEARKALAVRLRRPGRAPGAGSRRADPGTAS